LCGTPVDPIELSVAVPCLEVQSRRAARTSRRLPVRAVRVSRAGENSNAEQDAEQQACVIFCDAAPRDCSVSLRHFDRSNLGKAGAATSGTLVLRQNPAAELSGRYPDDEGEIIAA